jgi:hypothetical protein
VSTVTDVNQATPHDPWRSKRNPMRTAASTCALGALCAVTAVLGACTASSEDVRPPADQLFFPSGLVIAPGESVLFVANANAELRYDSGAIGVVDLERVVAVTDEWARTKDTPPAGCTVDLDRSETLECPTARFMVPEASVRIGNFATDIAVQDLTPGTPAVPSKLRVFVPTRGDPSIAWADYDVAAKRLSCGGGGGFSLCDDAHRLTFVNNDPAQRAIVDEPFGVFADSMNGFAIVSHQLGGALTLIDSPSDGDAVISDIQGGYFLSDQNTGVSAATGVAGRDGLVYVSSRTDNRIQTVTVGRPLNKAPPFLQAGAFFFLDAVGQGAGLSGDSRGLRFSNRGDRLYSVNRSPPSLHIYDTSLTPAGTPRNKLAGASDICRQATAVTTVEIASVERAYVTCFQTGEIYIVDPAGTSHVEAIVIVGRGPYAIAGSASRKQIYVSNFLDSTIAVIDVDPMSLTLNRVVLRIANPRVQ